MKLSCLRYSLDPGLRRVSSDQTRARGSGGGDVGARLRPGPEVGLGVGVGVGARGVFGAGTTGKMPCSIFWALLKNPRRATP
jgi:hypothetical protein